MTPHASAAIQRVKDTLEALRTEVDAWVATATSAGRPYLVPLSFYWER